MLDKAKALNNRLYITAVTAQNSHNGKVAKLRNIAGKVSVVFTMMMITMMMVSPVLATDPTLRGQSAIRGVLDILYLITNALGILFVIVGFVRLIIAYTQEDAPGQQRSSMFIAVGVALLAVKPILSGLEPEKWLTETGSGGTSSGTSSGSGAAGAGTKK